METNNLTPVLCFNPIKISKKKMLEKSYCTIYKGSGQKFPAIYFDWQSNDNGTGYKYLMVGFQVTKKELVDRMHHYLNNGMIGYSPKYRLRVASDDSKRFKAQLSGVWTFAGNS